MKSLIRIAAAGLILSLQPAVADVLDMDERVLSRDTPNVNPVRGASMAQVEAQYGAPQERVDAVGDPPISRWVYEDSIVYFEHDKVLHSIDRVVKR